jgi:hypothetical protein
MNVRRLVPALALASACGLLAVPGAAAKPPKGFTLVSAQDLVAPTGFQSFGSVTCPRGLVPLGGIAAIHSVSLQTNVAGSFPDPNGWTAIVNNTTGAPVTFEVDAVCALQPRNYSIVEGPFVSNPNGTQAHAQVTCPTGSKPLSGGVSPTSDSVFVSMNTSEPAGRSWEVFENNATPDLDGNEISAFAVCGKVPGYTLVTSGSVANPAGSHTLSFATCPDPTVAIGVGAVSDTTNLAVSMSGMGLDGTEALSSMNNASGTDFVSSTIAICAGK